MTELGRRYLLEGIRNAIVVPAWMVGFSLLGVGSLARDAGHPIWAALLSTVFVWAGPGQVVLYGGLVAGTALPAIAIAVALTAIRLMPMTIAVMPYLRRPGHTLARQWLAAHLVAMTAWVEAMRRLPGLPEEARLPYFYGFAGTCLAVSIGTTAAGYLLIDALPPLPAAGLMCLAPLYFSIALASSARIAADWWAIAFGAALAPAAGWLVGRNFDVVVAGIVGGTLSYGIARKARRNPA